MIGIRVILLVSTDIKDMRSEKCIHPGQPESARMMFSNRAGVSAI